MRRGPRCPGLSFRNGIFLPFSLSMRTAGGFWWQDSLNRRTLALKRLRLTLHRRRLVLNRRRLALNRRRLALNRRRLALNRRRLAGAQPAVTRRPALCGGLSVPEAGLKTAPPLPLSPSAFMAPPLRPVTRLTLLMPRARTPATGRNADVQQVLTRTVRCRLCFTHQFASRSPPTPLRSRVPLSGCKSSRSREVPGPLPPSLRSPELQGEGQGDLKIALRGGGGGGDMDARRRRGGGLEKWGSASGPLFYVRTDVGAKGAGTQMLARKFFFHQ